MKVEYFFVKEKIAQKDIEVKYGPTEKMWLDVMTKPQQGKLFREMRAITMNCPIDYDKSTTTAGAKMMKALDTSIPSSQGCVEIMAKAKNDNQDKERRSPKKYFSPST